MLATFIIPFLVICTQLSLNNANSTVCEKNDTSDIFIKRMMHDQTICYFVVKNVTERSHEVHVTHSVTTTTTTKSRNRGIIPDNVRTNAPEMDNDYGAGGLGGYEPEITITPRFEYSLEEARRVCCEHNATLPIIRYKAELEFIQSNFGYNDFSITGIWRNELEVNQKLRGFALGMNVSKEPYMWDDGSPIIFGPDQWEKSDGLVVGEFAYMELKRNIWVIGEVPAVAQNRIMSTNMFEGPLGIVCQQTKPAADISICKTIGKNVKKTTTTTTTTRTEAASTFRDISTTKVTTQNVNSPTTTTAKVENLAGDGNQTSNPGKGNNGDLRRFSYRICLVVLAFQFVATMLGNE